MNIITSRILAGVLAVSAVSFGWFMDGQGELNKDHQLVVQFQRGAAPSTGFEDTLIDAAQLANGNDNYFVTVIGHTGTRAPDDANMTLSEERAAAVMNALESGGRNWEGIDASRMTAVGAGETQLLPRHDHETDALWQRRLDRADIIIEVR